MLRTQTYNLADERDRLDDKLDDLAERSIDLEDKAADLQGRSATLDDDADELEAVRREFGELMDEQEDLQGEIEAASNQLGGIEWVIESYGYVSDTATSDPKPGTQTPVESAEDTPATVGDAESAAAGVDEEGIPESVKQARAENESSDDSFESTNETKPITDGGRDHGDDHGLTITVGGLTAGEYAQVTDKVGSAQNESLRVGGQQASVEGASQIFYCASGLVDAPFLDGDGREMSLDKKCEAVREVAPGLLAWLEDKITGLTMPSEAAGNGFERRRQAIREQRRT